MRSPPFCASIWLWVCECEFFLRAFHTPLMQQVAMLAHTATTRTHRSTMNPATLDVGSGAVVATVELTASV